MKKIDPKKKADFLSRLDPRDLIPQGYLRYRTELRVDSIDAYEKRYSRTGAPGLGQSILDIVERDWFDRTGTVIDFSDPDQLAEFKRMADVKRRQLGWPGWSSPAPPEEAAKLTKEPKRE